jgi:ubiquinone biosynthesis protein UbiJ
MDRRTGCLQANVEFLQQTLAKQARESNDKVAGVSRELAAAKAEIAALKAMLARLDADVAQLKAKAETSKK